MAHFLIIGYDNNDAQAATRRAAARADHLQLVRQMVANGEMVCGGAIVAEDGKPVGSAVFVSFPSRSELDAWLAREPYVVQRVWARVDVKPVILAVNGGKLLL